MDEPLKGIRVLEWGTFHAGPGGCAILGDLGAEVIKIEQPLVGDPMRKMTSFGHSIFGLPGGKNLFFEAANRNKKSVTIDLQQEDGRKIAYRLASKSDVFVTNFRKKTVDDCKMSYPVLTQYNPQLIYLSVSAYGSKGPDSSQGGFDFQGQARSGMMFALGEPDMPPLLAHFGIIDQLTSIMVSHAVITALLVRERSGTGQKLEVSLLGSALYMQYVNVLTGLLLKEEVTRHHRSDTYPLRNYYKCRDEKWLCIAFPAHWEKKWPVFCRVIGHSQLKDDPKFNSFEKRFENSREMITMLDNIFATKTREEWLEIFKQNDLISCAINSIWSLSMILRLWKTTISWIMTTLF